MSADDYTFTQIAHIVCLDPQIGLGDCPLNTERVEIGRSPLCQIVIANPRISRRHACIERVKLRYDIYDLGSRNSTFVNGRQLADSERYTLTHDDSIGLGSPDPLFQFIDPDPTIEVSSRMHYIRHSKKFSVDGKILPLTPNEQMLMIYLYEHINQLCIYRNCAESVWEENFDAERDKIRLQRLVSDLRVKLEKTNMVIEAQPRQGYILKVMFQ